MSKASAFGIRGGGAGGGHLKNSSTTAPPAQQETALGSIVKCYQRAFFSFTVNVALLLFTHQHSWESHTFILEMAQTLHKLGLGMALYSVTRELRQEGDGEYTLRTYDSVYRATRIMSGLWQRASWILVAVAAVGAEAFFPASSYQGPMVVLILAGIGSILLQRRETRIITGATSTDSGGLEKEAKAARDMSFRAARNMSSTWGAFLLLGLCQLVTALLNPNSNPPIPRFVGLADVLTNLTAAKLLSKLHTAFLPAIVTATATKSEDEIVLGEDLYQAQTEFYNKIAGVFTSEAILKIIFAIVQAFRVAKAI